METKISKNAFAYCGRTYFRGNSHLIVLCGFGEKKHPLGKAAYLDPEGHIKASLFAKYVVKSGPIEIDWSRQNAADVEAYGDLKYFGGNGTVVMTASYNKAKSAKLKLVSFSIEERPLKVLLNDQADVARKFLADEGGDGRIVSEVWTVMEGTLAENFGNSASLAYDAAGDDLRIKAGGSTSGSATITLAKGMVFAYKLSRVKDWSHSKTQVEDLEADYKGMD